MGKGVSVFGIKYKSKQEATKAGEVIDSKLLAAFKKRLEQNKSFSNSHAAKNTENEPQKGSYMKRTVAKGAKKAKNTNRTGYMPNQQHFPTELRHAALGFRPAFSMSQLQSWSGSELETKGIEFGVRHAGIKVAKFNRENKNLGGAAQIFNVKERTFFFKPRFNLLPIKEDRGNWKAVMKEVVTRSAGGAGKGEDDVETDVIESFQIGRAHV